jgi:energy-coupling factor transporter ATP-binding protein EcfA2
MRMVSAWFACATSSFAAARSSRSWARTARARRRSQSSLQGLLEPTQGLVHRSGRAAYLSQDPGRYVVAERVDEEVALGVGGDLGNARTALELVGLQGYEGRHPRDLSSGERERLALAAVLVAEPDLLVLDEPTRGMDPERKLELAALLRAQAGGRGTLVVTHDLLCAGDVAHRVISQQPAAVAVHA